MIMLIAMARDGFIDYNNNFNFYEFINDPYNVFFVEKDLQDFDGNTCKIISDYDPTNSVFKYKNQQGEFLYTITSATPFIHKNKKIWLCNCYEMEDLNKFNNLVLPNENASYENIVYYKGLYNAQLQHPLKIQIKDNFKPIKKYKTSLYYEGSLYGYYTLKIKCLTNPTTENLVSNAPDGSFNFLFPLRIEEVEETGKINKFTTKIKKRVSEVDTTLSLYQVISKYLPNIKSIELLPFKVIDIGDETILYDLDREIDVIDWSSGGVFTDCGIFVKTNYSYEYNDLNIDLQSLPNFNAKELIVGGGIKGFLQTPLGNIELQFNSELTDTLTHTQCLIKEDGWKIDGKFKCDVPPHYLNFYTDNAGQIFIQNLTTNAQALRQINRDKIAKEEEQQQNFVYGLLQNATELGANVITQNWGNALRTTGNIANSLVQNEFNKGKIERDYQRSLIEFKDKTKTESLLASMTGRHLNGQFSLVDFLVAVNNNYFCLYFETNFFETNGKFICQPDYDYSTDIENITYTPTFQDRRINANYVVSFRKYAVVDDEIRFSRNITIFLRNTQQFI